VNASEVAQLLGGERNEGDDPDLTGVAPLDRAGPSDLTFLAHARYAPYVETSRAGAFLVTPALANRIPPDRVRIVVEDVHRAMARLLPDLYPEPEREPGIHATAVLEPDVRIEPNAYIGPFAVVGERAVIGAGTSIGAHCVIGADCVVGASVTLHPHVTLYPGVRIGDRSILHGGVRVGVDGFGYVWNEGAHRKVPQVGTCVVGADVEIGANTTIDRGSIGATEIGDGVKIDNLVHIGHNVRVGEHTLIIAQVGVAGSTVIGKRVTLAGQAGIPGHLSIGDGATIAAQAGVFGDVPAGAVYSGYPARPHREALRAQAGLSRLPQLVKRVEALEQRTAKVPPTGE
jgi:UDP-3-O-[3-hydroxymyristoyl] glucosamine N-acyltransferase